jgi:hypothetical protein
LSSFDTVETSSTSALPPTDFRRIEFGKSVFERLIFTFREKPTKDALKLHPKIRYHPMITLCCLKQINRILGCHLKGFGPVPLKAAILKENHRRIY